MRIEQLRSLIDAMTHDQWEARDAQVWSVDDNHPDYDMLLASFGRAGLADQKVPVNQRDAVANASGVAAIVNVAVTLADIAEAATAVLAQHDRTDIHGDDWYKACSDARMRLRQALADLDQVSGLERAP